MMLLQLELKYVIFFAFLAGFVLKGNAQNQTGFISIDCGLQANMSNYDEKSTGLNYIPDEKFIDTGESKVISEEYKDAIQQPYWSLRSFPEGERNCYKIQVTTGTKYLIRTSFFYGNYDGQGMPAMFDLYLGPSLWDSVKMKDTAKYATNKEIIHVPQKSHVHICLVKTGHGVPFISAIELRPLDNSTYPAQTGSLAMYVRRDTGSSKWTRYGDEKDVYDRFWQSMAYDGWKNISTNLSMDTKDHEFDPYSIPSVVMSTAVTPKDENASLEIWWPDNSTNSYYIYMHFAEIEKLRGDESREFNISYNGQHFFGPVSPKYLKRTTVYTTTPFRGSYHNFSFSRTGTSTHSPIINAFETYTVKEFSQLESDEDDVDAITKLKSSYQLKRKWQGDPCVPKEYMWEGLNCSYIDGSKPPRIISLNLSSSELNGEIPTSIANLTMIEILDLSNNNFAGTVPDFLSQLPKLRVLNLENNELSGPLPTELTEKWKKGSLSLSVKGNPNLFESFSCKKKNLVVPAVVAAVVGGSFILLLAVTAIWWGLTRKRRNGSATPQSGQYSLESRKRQFTYNDIQRITNNFEKIIGKGGFGTVYHGHIDDTQVAVKMLSPSSVLGYQQFQAEVNILLRVHHKNLTSLVGYFTDKNNAGLVYEYMNQGDLRSHLISDNSSTNILEWEDRLKIAIDAGQGLEYLHHGCKPPIVHRDVKSANILLNENFQSKLSDFGISKTFPTDDSRTTHVSTVVAGTPGYLDPEYYKSNRLNEKSDVYSFGMVLLEIITGRPAMSKTPHENIYLSEWVRLLLEKGHIHDIVDPKLGGSFSINTAWKVVEIAMNCVSPSSAKRPTMNQVVGELRECSEIAKAEKNAEENGLKNSAELISLDLIYDDMSTQPLAR